MQVDAWKEQIPSTFAVRNSKCLKHFLGVDPLQISHNIKKLLTQLAFTCSLAAMERQKLCVKFI